MTVLMFIIGVIVGVFVGMHFFKKTKSSEEYILVSKSSGDSPRTADATYESFYFKGKKYPTPLPHLINDTQFFVPLTNLPKTCINRAVLREFLSDGAINYDYNGYDAIPEKDLKNALKVVDEEAIML